MTSVRPGSAGRLESKGPVRDEVLGLYDPELGTLHRLRHTFASDLAGNGTDLETLRDLLGHHSVQTTEIYLHTGMERKRAAVESL